MEEISILGIGSYLKNVMGSFYEGKIEKFEILSDTSANELKLYIKLSKGLKTFNLFLVSMSENLDKETIVLKSGEHIRSVSKNNKDNKSFEQVKDYFEKLLNNELFVGIVGSFVINKDKGEEGDE